MPLKTAIMPIATLRIDRLPGHGMVGAAKQGAIAGGGVQHARPPNHQCRDLAGRLRTRPSLAAVDADEKPVGRGGIDLRGLLRDEFTQIVAELQQELPNVDFGFGVGRFEDYGGEDGIIHSGAQDFDRPFILNQPIIRTSTTGFNAALAAALSAGRDAPGLGGDPPETLIEALYQIATGAGFDGDVLGANL